MTDCENIFCIYWQDRQCILRSISIDCLGICEDYIMVDIDEDYLKKKRLELLTLYEEEDRKMDENRKT